MRVHDRLLRVVREELCEKGSSKLRTTEKHLQELTIAFTRPRSTSTTPPLPRRRLRSPRLNELDDSRLRIEGILLDAPAIDDVHDAVNRDGRLGDVGRDDTLAEAGLDGAEDGGLLLRGEVGVEGEDFEAF